MYDYPSGLSLSGSVGYSQLSQSGQSSQGSVSSNSNLSYRFGPAFVSLGIFSDFQQTALTGQNFGIVATQGFTGTLGYTFTPLVSGAVVATSTNNGFTGSGNSSSSPNTNNLTTSANLTWQLRPWLK